MSASFFHARRARPSRSAATWLLLALMSGCAVTEEPTTCSGCHRDCGVLRKRCDAKPVCAPDAGDAGDVAPESDEERWEA